MAHYLVEVAYTGEAWAAQVSSPQNRIEAIRPVIERLGGRIESAYYAFGEYDVVGIMEMPDPVSAAAFSLAASALGSTRGRCRAIRREDAEACPAQAADGMHSALDGR